MAVYPIKDFYDLSATYGTRGRWRLNLRLHPGKHRTLSLTLKEVVSISGTLWKLDNSPPHVAVVVQAVAIANRQQKPALSKANESIVNSKVAATTLSDEKGEYRFLNLKPGRYQVRCYTGDGYIYYQRNDILSVTENTSFTNIDFHFAPFKKGVWKNDRYRDGHAGKYTRAIYRDAAGVMWFATNNGVLSYDGRRYRTFTTDDGLADNQVKAIASSADGVMWFGTLGGVSRYDANGFINLNTMDGLVHPSVGTVYQDRNGHMWFGTLGGVSRYDAKGFVDFTTEDGLALPSVISIEQDRDGHIWFGANSSGYRARFGEAALSTAGRGVFRYNSKLNDTESAAPGALVNFTKRDGLVSRQVNAISSAPDGTMWFATQHGVSHYDGERFVNFTGKDGLRHKRVFAAHSAADGVMWFGTSKGASRYDGKRFVNFTRKDGLPHERVYAIHSASDGTIWFGTQGGVTRHHPVDNGKQLVTYTQKDGLADNSVMSTAEVHHVETGRIFQFFGTASAGVSFTDGKAWSTLDDRDGLASNAIRSIFQDADGLLWFGTSKGVTRYQRSSAKSRGRLISIRSDEGDLDLDNLGSITAGTRLTITYSAVDFKTVPEKRQYRRRLIRGDGSVSLGWQITKEETFDYTFKETTDGRRDGLRVHTERRLTLLLYCPARAGDR